MTATLSAKVRALFDAPNFTTLATIDADGKPHTTVIWAHTDGDDIIFSTIVGRRKERNMRRDPRVSLTVYAVDDPYNYVSVQGTVTLTPDPPGDLIQEMSRKYTGKPWDDKPGVERLVVRITPDKVIGEYR